MPGGTMTSHGIDSEHMPAVDAAAWSLLALLFFCILCFAFGAWVLWRREKRRSHSSIDPSEMGNPTDSILPNDPSEGLQEEDRAPWERDENWWQKPPSD